MNEEIIKHYSRKDIQKEILELAKNREVAVNFSNNGFGKRPDILQYENDVYELAKSGATSFHVSEERWKNPLLLKAGMTKKELDELRAGWDLVIDVDAKSIKDSKITTHLILDALKFHDVEHFGLKFSGNIGFHICVPFESFPSKINNVNTRLLFPDGPKTIAAYLKGMIKEPLKERLKVDDPFSKIDIDTILISSRHLFRSPFSFHEKSGLVSIPIKPSEVMNFKRENAAFNKVKTNIKFLKLDIEKNEAKSLIMQAFDWQLKQKPEPKKESRVRERVTKAISEENFPPCISGILSGIKNDGRKRALFILINFLKETGYSLDEIKEIINDWNQKNYQPLKEGYIMSQLMWFKNQNKSILPPNCTNEAYYIDLGVCSPDNLCKLIKNPVNYTIRKNSFKKRK